MRFVDLITEIIRELSDLQGNQQGMKEKQKTNGRKSFELNEGSDAFEKARNHANSHNTNKANYQSIQARKNTSIDSILNEYRRLEDQASQSLLMYLINSFRR